MQRMNQEEGSYRVVLIGIEDDTEEKRESFCKKISENYSISFPLLKKIIEHCPTILKKNLSRNKAETLAKTLQSFGAIVSVEEKRDSPPIFLEFQEMAPHQVALESSDVRKTQSGAWNIIGRAKNISEESLNDTWVLIQIFNDLEDLFTFEEAPIPINPVPPGEAFPFKVVFGEDYFIKRVSIAFKNASGYPIPAVDRRKKKEWVEVEIKEEGGEKPQLIDKNETSEEIFIKGPSDIWRGDSRPSEPESPPLLSEESKGICEEGEGKTPGESSLLGLEKVPSEVRSETIEESRDLTLGMPKENGDQAEEELETSLENEPAQTVTPHLMKNGKEEDIYPELESTFDNRNGIFQETCLETPVFEGSPQLLEEISQKTMEREKELFSFPWIKDFRNSVETYYLKHRDIFSKWFETHQRESGFAHPFYSLLTILVHARFNQVHQSEKALENTQRVVRFVCQSNLRLEEIPPLEGTQFFSGENWRDLFHKAFPKLQQVANNILKKERWNAIDLERLIRVIPHMSDKNSRISVRWVHELIPDVVKIDFSNTPINIEESLYRVASRLGVVDPHFDYYQGRNSMGDLKIQSFAKKTFPQYPLMIEEPMTWVGRKEEEGGHCFPTQPRCEGCLFETFCPRLYFHFNPSGKGMRGR
jgi:hypothetical protein